MEPNIPLKSSLFCVNIIFNFGVVLLQIIKWIQNAYNYIFVITSIV